LIKTAQIKGLRNNMNKIAKFSSSILINKGLIKKKVEYKSKIAKLKTFKDLIEL
jgi:hypothetical protein